MFKCDQCGRDDFSSVYALRGHKSTHKDTKRAKGIRKRFIAKKYQGDPTRGLLYSYKLIEQKSSLPASRRVVARRPIYHRSQGSNTENNSINISEKDDDWTQRIKKNLHQLKEWVLKEDSPYNSQLVEWLSTYPLKTPNHLMTEERLMTFEGIPASEMDNGRTKSDLAYEYCLMLEETHKGVYVIEDANPTEPEQIKFLQDDITLLSKRKDMRLLLVKIQIPQIDGTHSYMSSIDFGEKTITFMDNGKSLSKEKIQPIDKIRMKEVTDLAKKFQPGRYKRKIITDAPTTIKKYDCAFWTCLFAKCMARKMDHRLLPQPSRKEILYEWMKGEVISTEPGYQPEKKPEDKSGTKRKPEQDEQMPSTSGTQKHRNFEAKKLEYSSDSD